MVNVPLKDNEKVVIESKPWTASDPGRPANAYAFRVDAVDPSGYLDISAPGGPVSNPSFSVRPKSSFFGPDRVFTLTLSGIDSAPTATRKSTDMTITVQGTLPDDGTLDRFLPVGGTPAAQ